MNAERQESYDDSTMASEWNVFKTGRLAQIQKHAERIQDLAETASELKRSGIETTGVLAKIGEHADAIGKHAKDEAGRE